MFNLLGILSENREMTLEKTLVEHLQRLLNSRAGSLNHLPDYGLIDLSTIYQDLPYSVGKLKQALITLIEHYEPRLTQVEIHQRPLRHSLHILAFEISAYFSNNKQLQFSTYFCSGGGAHVEQA